MKYETFKKVIEALRDTYRVETDLGKMGMSIHEHSQKYVGAIYAMFEEFYDTEGIEWISWYLWEKFADPKRICKAYDADGKEACRNMKELYDIVCENKKPKN